MTGAGWMTYGKIGTGPGEFSFPTGLALDAQGRLYITDEVHRLVRVNDMSGAGWTAFGSMGERDQSVFLPVRSVCGSVGPLVTRRESSIHRSASRWYAGILLNSSMKVAIH